MEYLTKKYGDKEQHHRSLVRQLSHATEKVINWLVYYTITVCYVFPQVAEMEKEQEDKMLVDKSSFERLQKGT